MDLSDTEYPVPLSLFDAVGTPERVADDVVSIFLRRYGAALGPRSTDLLHASVLTLAQVPGMTLAELPALIGDASFRRKVLAQISDRLGLEPFWSAFGSMSAGE
jgi:hypothetical protein